MGLFLEVRDELWISNTYVEYITISTYNTILPLPPHTTAGAFFEHTTQELSFDYGPLCYFKIGIIPWGKLILKK